MPRYIVFGAGAIGCILGAMLHRSGYDVVLVGRGSHVQAIRKEGLQVASDLIPRRLLYVWVRALTLTQNNSDTRQGRSIKWRLGADQDSRLNLGSSK